MLNQYTQLAVAFAFILAAWTSACGGAIRNVGAKSFELSSAQDELASKREAEDPKADSPRARCEYWFRIASRRAELTESTRIAQCLSRSRHCVDNNNEEDGDALAAYAAARTDELCTLAEELYQGFKGVQISHTSLVAHLRRESAPASIHTLATEQFNQDIVSLGLHAALGAAEMETKLRDVVAMTLMAACQAIDLRGSADELAPGSRLLYDALREVSVRLDKDRPLDSDIASVARAIADGVLPLPSVKMMPEERNA